MSTASTPLPVVDPDLGVAAILGPDGAIARRLSSYEPRAQQLAMAEAVAHAIATKTHLVVEAGTGVGKSFAYLVPAVLAAVAAGKTVVVSTHTIGLQEQLILKDIPFLRSILPPFDAVLVKGRGNYLSLRRLEAALAKAGKFFDDAEASHQLGRIREWAEATRDGSRSDLDFQPFPAVWDEVASDKDNCKGKKCPTYKQCFYYMARRRLEKARVLIANHAVVMTDLAMRRGGNSFLPDYDVLILDEAHTLEAVASDHLGDTISSGQVEHLLKRIGKLEVNRQVSDLIERTRGHALELFGGVLERHGGMCRFREPTGWTDALLEDLRQLGSALLGQSVFARTDAAKLDLEAAGRRGAELAGTLAAWLKQDVEGGVYWTEVEPGKVPKVALTYAPLHVGPTLRKELFEGGPTCVLTSATLAVGRRFDHFTKRIGLEGCATLHLGSPFDYREQVELHLPRGLPCPSKDAGEFERAAIRTLPHYLEKSRGRAFVLFTSYQMLQVAARQLRDWVAARGWTLLSQGDGTPRAKMVERFKAGGCVLFGVDSFWAGVDVPGEALSNVTIMRLPFRVPDHPLIQARIEDIRAEGGNDFMEYTVPEAVIKLKQGFGRLIRSKTDRGIVVILDPRITTKPYGRQFLDSLPDCRRVVEDVPTATPPPGPGGRPAPRTRVVMKSNERPEIEAQLGGKPGAGTVRTGYAAATPPRPSLLDPRFAQMKISNAVAPGQDDDEIPF
jgi:ATP-dependent DNA helicase DinG